MQTYLPGTRIGQYEIASRPMMGGMGVVYFALDHGNDDRPVALKTFRPELLPERAARDRFLREGTAWVELGTHMHIVRCYAVEYIDPTAFLALELIAKEQGMQDASLRSWLGQPLPLDLAQAFALQVARGMQYAVKKIPGFVHRDLKPENLLVGADKLPGTNVNRLRVTDFGLAAILKDEEGRLEEENGPEATGRTHLTHGILGTPLYMAPEQWKGEPVGVYTDVYALGCILYEMLSGQPAAKGSTIPDLQAAHCHGDFHPLPDTLPVEVAALLDRCLALKPSGRWSEWEELRKALERAFTIHGGQPAYQTPAPEALSRAEQVQVGWSYNAIGWAYQDMGKADLAARFFERTLTVSQIQAERELQAAALNNLGSAYLNLGEVNKAVEFFEKRLILSREIGDWRGEGATLINMGNAYLSLGEVNKAIVFFEKGLETACELGDQRSKGAALGNLGSAYANLGELNKAIEFYEQALAIACEIGDLRDQGNALDNLGKAHFDLGEIHKAIEYHKKALVIAREIGDRHGEGITLGNLGNAFADLGEVHKAIEFFEKRLIIAREIGDRGGEGQVLGNLGIVYRKLGKVDKAIQFYEKRLIIAREIGDRRGEGTVLGNLGNAYADLGEGNKAIEFYEQALVIDREIGNINSVATVSSNMALLHARQGDPTRALPLAQEAAAAYARIGHTEYSRQAQQLIEWLHKNIGN
jgi:serine/threonine protein kinase